jgi:hypothetical protein
LDKSVYRVQINSILRSLEEPLRKVQNRYFNPEVYTEYFERFASIRSNLKSFFPNEFEVLIDREMPPVVATSDNEGKGYIIRRYIDQLFDDCRLAIDLLEVEAIMSEPRIKKIDKNELIGNEIFISHASKDEKLVKHFVEQILRLGLDIQTKHIFCTSLEGMDIKNGIDFRNEIQVALHSAKIIILIITPNYKASEVCQNEMGAAWYSGKKVIPLIVEPISYASVGVIFEPLQVPKINDVSSLGKLKDDITQAMGIAFSKTDLWETGRASFIDGLPKILGQLEFTKKRSDKEIEVLEKENNKLKEQASIISESYMTLQSKYSAICAEKGAVAVQKVEAQYEDKELLEKFKELTSEVQEALDGLSNVVKAIVVCSYHSAEYLPPDGYDDVIQAALRKKIISRDDRHLEANNDSREVKKIYKALSAVAKYLEESDDFSSQYESEYDSPLELDNEDFWTEHYGFNVPG